MLQSNIFWTFSNNFFALFDRLTVKKDGPNKGRPFYVCPKQPACQFFQWADVPATNNSFPTSSHTGTSTRPSASSSNLNENTTQGQGNSNNWKNINKKSFLFITKKIFFIFVFCRKSQTKVWNLQRRRSYET